jgi:hypothetical protein
MHDDVGKIIVTVNNVIHHGAGIEIQSRTAIVAPSHQQKREQQPKR